jgi:hypothetical protein
MWVQSSTSSFEQKAKQKLIHGHTLLTVQWAHIRTQPVNQAAKLARQEARVPPPA